MTERVVWVDATPVREHVERLLTAGLTKPQIARRSGVATNTITALLVGVHGRGPSERVRQDTAGRLLAVEPELVGPESRGWISPIGTMRRLRSLLASGWTVKEISALAGIPRNTIWPILNDCAPVIRVTTRDRVLKLYEQLTQQPAPPRSMGSTWARNRAARRAWPLPCVWSGNGIDDPDGRPVNARYPVATAGSQSFHVLIAPETARQWAAVVEHWLDDDPGLTIAQVATRFDRDPATVRSGLDHAGRPDLADRLMWHHSFRTPQWWAQQVEDLLEVQPDLTFPAAIEHLHAPALDLSLATAGRDDLRHRLKRNTTRHKYRETR